MDRFGKRTHGLNEEVVIMITASEKATQQHYEWAASTASRVVLYESGHIDIVCTRASNIGTSKSTHTDTLLHTRFLSDLWHGEGEPKKQGITSRHKKQGGKSSLLLSCATRRS